MMDFSNNRLDEVLVTFKDGSPFQEKQITHKNARVTRQSLPTYISVYREIMHLGKLQKVEISYRTEDVMLIEEIR